MINVNELTKTYSNDKKARGIFDISFSVGSGEIICLLGQSGAGKTTLLRVLAGLENYNKGSVQIPANEIVAYVPQNYILWPHLNVLENLTLAPLLSDKNNTDKIFEFAKSLLREFELGEYEKEYPQNLSGGQKQRVALLRAIMVKPKILLLDEITSALDPVFIHKIAHVLGGFINKDVSVVISTHNISFAEKIADRILFLKNGYLIKDLKKSDFFNITNHKEIISFIKDLKRNLHSKI